MAKYLTFEKEEIIRIDRINLVRKCMEGGYFAVAIMLLGNNEPVFLKWSNKESRDRAYDNMLQAIGKDSIGITVNIPQLERQEEERKAKEQESMKELLSTDLRDCNLKVKTVNTLRSLDIHTIGDLTKWTKRGLLKVKGLGKKTYSDVEDFLDSVGLELKG